MRQPKSGSTFSVNHHPTPLHTWKQLKNKSTSSRKNMSTKARLKILNWRVFKTESEMLAQEGGQIWSRKSIFKYLEVEADLRDAWNGEESESLVSEIVFCWSSWGWKRVSRQVKERLWFTTTRRQVESENSAFEEPQKLRNHNLPHAWRWPSILLRRRHYGNRL